MADYIILFVIAIVFALCMMAFNLNIKTQMFSKRVTYWLMWVSFFLAMYAMFEIAKMAVDG